MSKFDARASSCVFMGNSLTHKEYKVLNLATRKFLVSRDIIFYERHFPFHFTSSPNTTHTPTIFLPLSTPLQPPCDYHILAIFDTPSFHIFTPNNSLSPPVSPISQSTSSSTPTTSHSSSCSFPSSVTGLSILVSLQDTDVAPLKRSTGSHNAPKHLNNPLSPPVSQSLNPVRLLLLLHHTLLLVLLILLLTFLLLFLFNIQMWLRSSEEIY